MRASSGQALMTLCKGRPIDYFPQRQIGVISCCAKTLPECKEFWDEGKLQACVHFVILSSKLAWNLQASSWPHEEGT